MLQLQNDLQFGVNLLCCLEMFRIGINLALEVIKDYN